MSGRAAGRLLAKGGLAVAGLVVVGLTLLLVAAVSRPLSTTPVTPAMVVVAVGLLGPCSSLTT